MKAHLAEAIVSAYRYARREASAETGLPEATFPADCPWAFERFMDGEFWPENDQAM